eukprot:TRINITY_DN186_c0_g1_i3.p1 TRINITY_DN186_c0_g1~~TRINITY_DN186_c0_g1_i3.p1  ORF type:complete len:59 (+),score=4.58 TRINITY_DN186_c0_g1_i3:171-347(+)
MSSENLIICATSILHFANAGIIRILIPFTLSHNDFSDSTVTNNILLIITKGQQINIKY